MEVKTACKGIGLIHRDAMPEDKRCKLLVPSGTFDQQKKRKNKSKRNKASTTAAGNTEKALAALLPLTSQNAPPQSPPQPQIHISRLGVSNKKSSSCRKIKTIHKDSSELELGQATESLRWEGILQDPKAEAERLEQYRVDRRRRYIVHRETLIKQTHETLRQKLSKECRQAKSDQLALSFS